MRKTTIINLWAGPGAGKSTLAADIFQAGKRRGRSIELVREAAKEVAWSGGKLNQEDNWREQLQREAMLFGKVDFIVTDGPSAISAVYAERDNLFETVLRINEVEQARRNEAGLSFLDLCILRTKPYVQAGRWESEEQARGLDGTIHGQARRCHYMTADATKGVLTCVSEYKGSEFWDLVETFRLAATPAGGED